MRKDSLPLSTQLPPAAPAGGDTLADLLLCCLTLGVFYAVLVLLPERREAAAAAHASPEARKVAETARLLAESKDAIHAGDLPAAAALSEKLLADDPENYLYMDQLIEVYRGLKRYGDEAAMWERYMLVAPTPDHGCPGIGLAWQNAGNDQKALAAFVHCREMAPVSDNIYYLARAYERAHDYDKALALYEEGVRGSPDYADMVIGLGRMQMFSGNPAGAADSARRVLAAKPDNSDALLLLGMALRRTDDLAGARKALERGVAVSPGYTDFHYLLGLVAEDQDRDAEAIEHYRAALKLSPGRDDVKARLRRLTGGD